MAIIFDLYIDKGSNFEQAFDLVGDQTNVTVRSKLKDSSGAITDLNASWTTQNLGKFELVLTANTTANLAKGIGWYDVELEDAAGAVSRCLKGRVYIDEEITI